MIKRNLDGVYFRVKRDGKFESICFSDLTESEMRIVTDGRPHEFMVNLCIFLAETIRDIGDSFDLYGNIEYTEGEH